MTAQDLPIDVWLLILRFVCVADALAIFAVSPDQRHVLDAYRLIRQSCKRFYLFARCKSYWVYADLDIMAIIAPSARQHVDYSSLSITQLRVRVLDAVRVHEVWKFRNIEPKRVHKKPISSNIQQVVPMADTELAIVVAGDLTAAVWNWVTGTVSEIPIRRSNTLFRMGVTVRWVNCLHCYAVVIHSILRQRTWVSKYTPTRC